MLEFLYVDFYNRHRVAAGTKAGCRARGVKLRYITDVTRENFVYCKRQMKM